jgi:hypothetical protein
MMRHFIGWMILLSLGILWLVSMIQSLGWESLIVLIVPVLVFIGVKLIDS